MPNWCRNILAVGGPSEAVDQFIKDQDGDNQGILLFSKSVPEPTSGDISEDIYQWRIDNWGTGSDPVDVDIVVEQEVGGNKTVKYFYNTGWSPAALWFGSVAKKYPQLRFSYLYAEPDNYFGGSITAVDGKIISHEEGKPEEFLPKEMLW